MFASGESGLIHLPCCSLSSPADKTRLASNVITTYQAYRNVEDSIDDKIVLVESLWTKVEIQLRFLDKITSHMNEELAKSHFNLLQKLKGKLLQTVSQLESTSLGGTSIRQKTSDFLKKWKFAIVRSSLDELVAELEAWQQRFDPTWYLIILISGNVLDSELLRSQQNNAISSDQKTGPLGNMLALRSALKSEPTIVCKGGPPNANLHLDASGLKGAKETAIPFTTARATMRVRSSKLLIIESVAIPSGAIAQVKVDIENLARKLQQIDPEIFGLLQCYGLLKRRDPTTNRLTTIEVVYRAPPSHGTPNTLRHHLLKQEPTSLSTIMRIAKQMVRSVSYTHTCDFVHKNIRPENILIFSSDDSSFGPSSLLGFTQFRNAHFQTNLCGDSAWNRNLYRHPQRQGTFVQERYVMQHDIYSLGVCLLELGLWRSFVWYPAHDSNAAPVPGVALGLSISDKDFEAVHSPTPLRIKEHLVAVAKKELPPRVGDAYTDIVLACLTCLDPSNVAFGFDEELRDEDGIVIGVRFVENILGRINEISI